MTDTPLQPGMEVLAWLYAPGGSKLGDVSCIVLNAGAELDLIISPGELVDDENRECLEGMLRECDMRLEDLREGPVYILRNCQRQDIEIL